MPQHTNPEHLPVGGLVHAFIAEGATNVWSDAMRGIHEYHERPVGMLALHNFIRRDGVEQPMRDNRNVTEFERVGVPVQSLDRRDEGDGSLPVYTQVDLEKLSQHINAHGVMTLLEEYPLPGLEQIDTDKLPPVVVNLYRSADNKAESHLQSLRTGLQSGIIAGVTVDADASRDAYVRKGISPNAIHVIHNGIDIERFAPSESERARVRNELHIGDEDPTVLLVARDSPEKDIPLFVSSARIFLEHNPHGQVIMAGPGLSADNSNIASLFDEYFNGDEVLLDRLHALGARPDFPAMYNAADVLALTSATESRPLCITEAQASGLGVAVSTNVGDAPSMIGEHGFITGRDPEEIAARWQEAYDKRAEIGFKVAQRGELGTRPMIAKYDQALHKLTS